MEQLRLVYPTMAHERAAQQFKQEFFTCGEKIINGSALLDQLPYDQWLEHTRLNRACATVQPGWVRADTFFAIREKDGRIVGIIDIRHHLDNDFLARYGGHIGYAVRPSERRKGYATQMLRQALEYAGTLGLTELMLGCYADNIASKKTIMACGGQLREEKDYLDGSKMEVYWITL